jgi:quinol monooxygenase YgiN
VVVARLAKFYFKTGKREEGFSELDLILNKQVRSKKGYRGYVSLFSRDQDDAAIILTMWEDDESFLDSQELFSSTMEKVTPFFERQPDVEHYRVDTVNLNQ